MAVKEVTLKFQTVFLLDHFLKEKKRCNETRGVKKIQLHLDSC